MLSRERGRSRELPCYWIKKGVEGVGVEGGFVEKNKDGKGKENG